jgi:hypothetical protein
MNLLYLWLYLLACTSFLCMVYVILKNDENQYEPEQNFLENQKLAEIFNNIMNDVQFSNVEGPFAKVPFLLFANYRLLHVKNAEKLVNVLSSQSVHLMNQDKPISSEEPDFRFDWEDKGAVNPTIHDQGSLGTCAAFATIGNIEGQRFLNSDGRMETLSVEQIVECSSEFDKEKHQADCGVFGGWPKLVLDHVVTKGGIATEKEWPYCSGTLDAKLNPQCFPCMPKFYSKEECDDHDDDFFCDPETTLGQNKDTNWCFNKNFKPSVRVRKAIELADTADEEMLRLHLESYGPLAVTLTAGPLQLYRRGILDPSDVLCARTGRPDHAALLTGYGVEKGKPYWRLKNSWGRDHGEHGYFRLIRGKNACGIGRFQVVTAVGVEAIPENTESHIFLRRVSVSRSNDKSTIITNS